MDNYYKELPEGYREVYTIDCKKGKIQFLLNIASLIVAVAVAVPVFIIGGGYAAYLDNLTFMNNTLLLLFLIIYLVMHELLHGIVYKIMTRQRLKLGVSLLIAYCGVPDIYVSRKTALISLCAPLVVFSVILFPLMIIFYKVNLAYYFLTGLLFVVNFASCSGDIYDISLLLFRFKDPKTLINDTGPKQTFYSLV